MNIRLKSPVKLLPVHFQTEQLGQQVVAEVLPFLKFSPADDGQSATGNQFLIPVQREGIDVEVPLNDAYRPGADADIVIILNDVFIYHPLAPGETPGGRCPIATSVDFPQDNVIKLPLPGHINAVKPPLHGVLLVRGSHQRVEGSLVYPQLFEGGDISGKLLDSLAGEIEDEIGVDGGKVTLSHKQLLLRLLPAKEDPADSPENTIIETLHPDG